MPSKAYARWVQCEETGWVQFQEIRWVQSEEIAWVQSQEILQLYVAFDGISLLMFGGLVIAALRARLSPQVHKRLMLMAMLSLLPPAYGRFVAYFTHVGIEAIVLGLMSATVLSCIAIDAVRHRRLHPTLAWCGALVIAVNVLTYVAQTE